MSPHTVERGRIPFHQENPFDFRSENDDKKYEFTRRWNKPMIRTYRREKLLNAILHFVQNTKYCGKTKLMKLLYFLDFQHFKETGKSVTGLEYFAWDWGPVPVALFMEISNEMPPDLKATIAVMPGDKFQKIAVKGKYTDEYFTRREKRLLERISEIYAEAKAEDIVEVSHLPNQPWQKTCAQKGMKKQIDYILALDDMPDSLQFEEAKERMEEIGEMHKIFGTD